MSEKYRSPYEAYPFLSEAASSYACDFEILTDEIASRAGLVRALAEDEALRGELYRICELVYHLNPTLRTHLSVTEEETRWLRGRIDELAAQNPTESCFVLPLGCEAACQAHLARVRCKALVRLIYRHLEAGGTAPEALIDLANLFSGYFYLLALELNRRAGTTEATFESRNY